ncbi:MAG: nicotinate phosphoribosyltransferase [SAR202 cluster bacterium]|nr:nicotinate phosphoribosyltransferase [SAR202 cluster bacterium]|tara:strand:+ start:18734 stop:20083 length:1350 start_codon:yes stop_codon:yes gene_type:complete
MNNPGALLGKDSSLFVDLYELTMAQSYLENGMSANATFSLFVRSSKVTRSYLVFAGLAEIIDYILAYSFHQETIEYLKSTNLFNNKFLAYLENFRFTGTIRSMREGAIFFYDEPIMEVEAPIIEAQILETLILNLIHHQTLIATKAARCISAANKKSLSDFSLRRSHGIDAGMKSARSSFLVGFDTTSNVLAGKTYGIPLSGTMAHSYVSSFQNEIDAFRTYAQDNPTNTVLLIDTYHVATGAKIATIVGKEMESRGQKLKAVRIDSGDLASLSSIVRYILDDADLQYVQIIASGGLDEYQISDLVDKECPIDVFGIGTRLGISEDMPSLDMVYKLVNYNNRDIKKSSEGKEYLSGKKQVFRVLDENGNMSQDIIGSHNELAPRNSTPLLEERVDEGNIVAALPDLETIRGYFIHEFSTLDAKYKLLEKASKYPVSVSNELKLLQNTRP